MKKSYDVDVLVVGGGVSGVVAAIAAARRGARTILIHNRPSLGGPSSDECSYSSNGVGINGASEYKNRNARECGIVEEMKLEAFYRRAYGWDRHWSLILREWCEAEENLTMLLNTEAYELTMDGARIQTVVARTLNSEITHTIHARMFIDCSGDSFLGAEAGAEFRMGREGKAEFGEALAQEVPDRKTMGSSIAFHATDRGKPMPFRPPSWALKIRGDEDLPYRIHNQPSGGFWWLEFGGELNTITDHEAIHKTLLRALFGLWDHMKNGGDHGAANYVIDWISSIPGKRESRRLMGDVILTQNDLVAHTEFDDAVAYGGWPVDLHPPEGIFGKSHPGSTPPMTFPGVYAIPFRALYSRNIDNLLMAGRNISVTHVALGSTRVMATCALCGQAAGIAAALAAERGLTPRELGAKHGAELRQRLAEEDAVSMIAPVEVRGIPARVTASGEFLLQLAEPTKFEPLIAPERSSDDPCDLPPEDRRRIQWFPATAARLEQFRVRLRGADGTEVRAALLTECEEVVASATAKLAGGVGEFQFAAAVIPGRRYGVRLEPADAVDVGLRKRYLPGIERKLDGCYLDNWNWCFETTPALRPYGAANAVNGLSRPTASGPNLWISGEGETQWLQLAFDAPETVDCVEVIFDTNLDKACTTGVPPECVRDYRIEACCSGVWETVAEGHDNHQRRRLHRIAPVTAEGLRLMVTATHGDNAVRVYEFRALRRNCGETK